MLGCSLSGMGIPAEVLSDRGANFLSSVMKTLFQMLGVAHIKTSPYHPQTDGMLERFHGTLKAMLRKTCPVAKYWDQWLPYLCFAFRDAPHSATGFSPFELLFGRDVQGPLILVKEQWESRSSLNPLWTLCRISSRSCMRWPSLRKNTSPPLQTTCVWPSDHTKL